MEQGVVVCNVFSDDNKGGSAITQQTIEWLKGVFPKSPVCVVPVEPLGTYEEHRNRFTLQRHPDTRIIRSPIRTDGSSLTTCAMLLKSFLLIWGKTRNSEFERTIANARVVVSKGGYVFVERNTIGGVLALWFTAFPLIFASKKKVPTVALCTTVGPYKRTLSKALCGWILRGIDLVVTRDPISTEQARQLGCKAVRQCPDIAWTFDEGRIDPSSRKEHVCDENYGVVVVSDEVPSLDDTFLSRLRELSERILNEKLVDRLVVVLQSLEDSRISARFLSPDNDPRYLLIECDLAPEQLMGIYKDAQFLIAKRLHAGVFALIVGTPTVLFSTDGVKADGVMRELGLSNRVIPYPYFSVDEVHRIVIEMIENRADERRVISKKVHEARLRAGREMSTVGGLLQVPVQGLGS
ncbi:MAG: polysaccharide pyruvyl transferase family protein [Gemmatimonadota bacterium]